MKVKHYNEMMAYLTRPGFNGGGAVSNRTVLPKRKPAEEVKRRKKINYEKIKQYLGKESQELIERELGFKIGGQVIIDTYNQSKTDLGRNPSVEELRDAVQKVEEKGRRPTLDRVRKVLGEANLELFEPRGGLKKAILQAHTDLTKELGKPPTTRQIDELTKNLSKQESAVQRSSVISEYLNEAGKKFTVSDAGRAPKARAKAAETLKAKERPRLGQLRKTPKEKAERERYKRMEDIKRDPKRIKRKLSDQLTGTPLDVHHPFPKREKETLRTLMLLDQDVNRKGDVRKIEIARNELIREQNILVNRPAKNRRRLEQINAQMKRFRAELRKTPYGGFLGFPVSNERGKISYIGFDKAKSLAGLREGDKMLDKDFAKASKNQVTKILNTANSSLVNAVNKLPPIVQGQICNSLQAGGLSKTCARAIKENPSKTAEIVEQKTLNLKPSKAATNALKAARFVKNIAGPLAIAGEVGIEGLMIGDKYLETGMPLKQVFGESILNLALGPKLRVDVEAERAKEFAKGEDFAMAERGRRKAPFLAQGEYADRLRREARIAEMQQKFPGVSEDALKQELLKQNPNIDLSLFPVSDFKQAVDNQIKTEYFADNFRQEKAGGGVMKMAGKPSGPAPKSGPTPDGPSKGLAYLFKNGMEEEE
jgi:NACalpha-BTF3-like transcription factor